MRTRVYEAWRKAEAYAVPMTEEGQQKAEERFHTYSKGFYDGLREAVWILENMHKEVKDNGRHHNFYLIASNKLKEIGNKQ